MYRYCFSLIAALAGCASAPEPAAPPSSVSIDQQILEAAGKVHAAQLQLVRAGALNQSASVAREPVAGPAKGVTLAWKGDALQLLKKLAAERSLDFVPSGAQLPLPVVISVKGATFERVIEQLQSQVGYRASIELAGNVLRLQYNRPRN